MSENYFRRSISLLLALFMVINSVSGAALAAPLHDHNHEDHDIVSSGEFLMSSASVDHLIINQAAGVGKNADGAISHSFVELYNPTENAVNLNGMSLQYVENGNDWVVLPLTGTIPAECSYLIRMNGSTNNTTARYTIYYTDQQWDIVISNDSYKFALVDSINALNVYNPGLMEGVIDLLGSYNAPPIPLDFGEGNSPVGGMSKQKSVRRVDFNDTDNNSVDFAIVDYRSTGGTRTTDEELMVLRPRSLRDGAWLAGDSLAIPEAPPIWSIAFDHEAGLYENQFNLGLTIEVTGSVDTTEYEIRYTLDGDDPSIAATLYSGALLMRDRTLDPAPMSDKDNITAGASHGTYYKPAADTIYKGTVVKAQVFDASGNPVSDVFINSYFVNSDIFNKYGDLPIISISTPESYFFDANTGIYVTGNGSGNNWDNSWERPANFEMFDPAAGYDRVISQGMGVRIHGGASRNNAQKSLRFYTRIGMVESYILHNGKSTVDYDLFQGAAKDYSGKSITEGFKRFILRANGTDAQQSLLRDPLSANMAFNFANEIMAYRPAVAFLNGEFWGIYQIRERSDEEYIAQHYGGNKDNYSFIEDPSTAYADYGGMTEEQGTPEEIAYYLSVVNTLDSFIVANGINTAATYNEFLKYVDEDSLIDFAIIGTFIGNNDWVNKNKPLYPRFGKHQKLFRYTGTANNKPGQDGKYRFIFQDGDFAFFGSEANVGGGNSANTGVHGMAFDSIACIMNENPENFYFFNQLMLNDIFRVKFINRYMDILNSDFSLDALHALVDKMTAEIQPVIAEQGVRWNYTKSSSAWMTEINRIKSNMTLRTSQDSAVSGITRGLNLLAGVDRNSLSITMANGHVRLNGMDLEGANWNGYYYEGYSQKLTALPDLGYVFEKFILTDENGLIEEVFDQTIDYIMHSGTNSVTVVFTSGDDLPEGLMILQAYGAGTAADGSLSHSFIELYNPSNDAIVLDGMSLQYSSDKANDWEKIELSGTIPARTSYLVRANGGPTANTRYEIYDVDGDGKTGYDLHWNIVIDNRSMMFALVDHQDLLTQYDVTLIPGLVSYLASYNSSGDLSKIGDNWNPLVDVTKQKSARRVDFSDELVSLDYRLVNMTNDKLIEVRPCSLADGAWTPASRPALPKTPHTSPVNLEVIFSQTAGLYETEFALELSTEVGYTIRYTLDGEDPTASSPAYVSSLLMRDRTSDNEILSHMPNTTGPGDMTEGRYNPPSHGTNFKGTVVKAQAFDAQNQSVSRIFVNSYFVSAEIAKYNLPVISISIPQDYLFDSDIGIYVKGNSSNSDNFNYNQSGHDWERPTYLEMFENDGSRVIAQGMGVRIHGAYSRNNPQKNLRFYARTGVLNNGLNIIDGKSTVSYDLFQGEAKNALGDALTGGFKRFMLRAAGNDCTHAFLRDPYNAMLAHDFFAGSTQAYRPVFAFINGEFWGLYDLRERFDEEYLAQVYGGSGSNYTILENPTDSTAILDQGVDADVDYYVNVVNSLKGLNMSDPATYDLFKSHVDEDNLIDYVIINTFAGNDSWPHNNQRIWRYTGTPDGKIGHDGKYRWLAYDMDMTIGGGYPDSRAHAPSYDTLQMVLDEMQTHGFEPMFFFNNMWKIQAFKDKFINRYMDLLNTYYLADMTGSLVNNMANAIDSGIQLQKTRWNYTLNYASWLNQISGMASWTAQRANLNTGSTGGIIQNGLRKHAISQDIVQLTIKNQDNRGYITLNGIELRAGAPGVDTQGQWVGNYFAGYTQTLTATAIPGETFQHFLIIPSSGSEYTLDDSTIKLMLDGSYTVTAVYELAPVIDYPNVFINQAAGIGSLVTGGANGAISHSFVELYNYTDEPVSLAGWSLQYAASGSVWEKLDFPVDAVIPARSSYLIRMSGEEFHASNVLKIASADLYWDMIVSNENMKFALVGHQNALTVFNPTELHGVIDLVGADNPNDYADYWWGQAAVGKFSKQQSVRRDNFSNYKENWYDFKPTDYRVANGMTPEKLETVRPRTTADGAWGMDLVPPGPPPHGEATIEFSQPAGLYATQFNLSLTTTSNHTIHYTLDGSDPKNTSTIYTDALNMYDRTSDAEVLAKIGGTLGTNDMSKGQYRAPADGTNFKGTVVKAQLFDSEGNAVSQMYINSYFVSEDIFNKYGGLPVISISTPAENFFDSSIGLYVNNNFNQEGAEWERPSFFEMFEPDGTRVIDQGMGVRIHGGWTRDNPQKTLRFYARSGNLSNGAAITNGKGSVNYDLFQGEAKDIQGNSITTGFTRFLLRSAGNDLAGIYNIYAGSFIRDPLTYLLTRDYFAFDTMSYQPVVAFLNGEFWGLYNLRERYDDEYLALTYGGRSGDYAILENPNGNQLPTLNDGTVEDQQHYVNAVNSILSLNMSLDTSYEFVKGIIDEDSLIDYVIIESFIANRDWAWNNQRIWRYKGTPSDAPGHDGKYRWMLYDTDESYGAGADPGWGPPVLTLDTTDPINVRGNHDSMIFFKQLMKNPNFMEKFVNRYMDCLNTYLQKDVTAAAVNKLAAGIDTAIQEQKTRWNYTLEYSAWQNNVSNMINWLAKRTTLDNGVIPVSVANYAKNRTIAPLTLVNQGGLGHIVLNGMELATGYPSVVDQASWTGNYFVGYVQTLNAVANVGETFQKYIIVDNTTGETTTEYNPELTLVMTEKGYTITAMYGEIEEDIIINVVGGTTLSLVAFTGDLSSLPSEVMVNYLSGKTEAVEVVWNTAAFLAADDYDNVVISGLVSGTEIAMIATIRVIPSGLVYFIDAGTVGSYSNRNGTPMADWSLQNAYMPTSPSNGGSTANLQGSAIYDVIKAKMGSLLLNNSSDQIFNGSNGWGIVEETVQTIAIHQAGTPEMMLKSGYSGWNNREDHAAFPKYLEYKLDLPAGDYVITTGHYAWWGDTNAGPSNGNWPRDFYVSVNDTEVMEPKLYDTLGQYDLIKHPVYTHEGGELSLKVHAATLDGVPLTLISVQEVSTAENYAITFVAGEEITTIDVAKGETVSQPADPIKGEFSFKGWYRNDALYNFDEPVNSNFTLVAVWDEPAGDFTILSDTHYVIAAYVSETSALPSSVTVEYENGYIDTVPVAWENINFNDADLYRTINVTATVADSDLTVTAEVIIIPDGVVYFVDVGTSGFEFGSLGNGHSNGTYYATSATGGSLTTPNVQGSTAYDIVANKVGDALLNEVSDKIYSEGSNWGVVAETVQFPATHLATSVDARFADGYAGWNNTDSHAAFPKYIEYKLYLPAGEYIITTGHYAWWGDPNATATSGNWPRDFDVRFNGNVVMDTFLYDTFAQNNLFEHVKYVQAEDGELSLTVHAVNLDGAPLTFIGVQEVAPTAVYTITFEAVNGSDNTTQSVIENGLVDLPEEPVRDGYSFLGWFIGEDKFDFATPITSNVTLTALWQENAVVLESISLTQPTKTTYFVGEELNLADLVVTAKYSNGSEVNVTDYTTNIADGVVLDTAGIITITITYAEGEETKIASFVVNVKEAPVIIDPVVITVANVRTVINSSVLVPVTLTNNPGVSAVTINIVLDEGLEWDYDPVAYSADSSTWPFIVGDVLEMPGHPTNNGVNAKLTASSVILNFINDGSNVYTDGTLVTLKLKVGNTAGEEPINITVETIIDEEYADISFEVINGSVTVNNIIYGDVNGDGKVNIADYQRLVQWINGWDVDIDLLASDVNGDGKINIADYQRIVQWINGWDVVLGS